MFPIACSSGTGQPPAPAGQPPASAQLPVPPAGQRPVVEPGETARPAPGTPAVAIHWSSYFGQRAGCFVGFDARTQEWTRLQAQPAGATEEAAPPSPAPASDRCDERHRPFSTFKIPHALIGLETGALAGADTVIPWDARRYPARSWWPDSFRRPNDLASAMANSVVPYFRTLSRRIGAEAMQKYLHAFEYGNRAMTGGLDQFWLDGDLAISAVEQVAFLRALARDELPASARSMAIVRDVLVRRRGPGYVLRAKTGTGRARNGDALGWYVGWVERTSSPTGAAADSGYYFAVHVSGKDYDDPPRRERIAAAEAILRDLGALPAE